MTRKTQKQRERAVLDYYMASTGINGSVEEGPEPPDYIVRSGDKAIAVEITEYHQPLRTAKGHTRREVEAAWHMVREHVVGFRKNVAELDKLSVGLEFIELAVPSTREIAPFVRAVADKIVAARSSIDDIFCYLRITDADPPILGRYLRSIRVRFADCYMEWDWNYDFGGVGTSDSEMMDAVGAKLAGYRRSQGVDESHLVIAGGGSLLSQIAAPIHEDELASFEELSRALEASAFDQVTIFDIRDFVWRRGIGWRPLNAKEPNS